MGFDVKIVGERAFVALPAMMKIANYLPMAKPVAIRKWEKRRVLGLVF